MSLDHPDPLPAIRRRPFDEVLEEFAAKTGRPLWKVTRVQPTEATPGRRKAAVGLSVDETIEMWRLWTRGVPASELAQIFGVALSTVYGAVKRGRSAELKRERAA